MIPKLQHYKGVAGHEAIKTIKKEAETLQDLRIVHMNSTSMGGGVAEILNTLVLLMNDSGLRAGWRVMLGSQSFFKITKGIHNALQGQKIPMSHSRKEVYKEYMKRNAMINHIKDHDIVVIHDPQPCGMVGEYSKKTKWFWRCHIDISNAYQPTLNFLLPYIRKYDGIIISSKAFHIKNVKRPQHMIAPSIDPLSRKNEKLSRAKARAIIRKAGIDVDKPMLTQISRFDPWKDPLGVIRMYEKIREKEDCHLVLMGDMASDDPQGPLMYRKVCEKADKVKDIHLITEKNDVLVNALQQESNVVFQNSVREGFGLTVSEALWKETPVIARPRGGIPLQVIDGKTGYLAKSEAEGVKRAIKLLQDKQLAKELGKQGKDHVQKNFLVTRHLEEYLKLFNKSYT